MRDNIERHSTVHSAQSPRHATTVASYYRASSSMGRRARAWSWWLGLLAAAAGARELDPAACAARFDVQRDKIIRTEESREMGARYLSELDVGARPECLRLCCETERCDVFVYEEKGGGSCYLFECGPPEDFRCKFTTHGNFSSGVLALSRRLAELQDQELRRRDRPNLRSASSTTPSSSTRAPPYTPPSAGCSRYQFQCRAGAECIAVYNACDGVPQCADGSDEAPELGCPTPPPPRSTPKAEPQPHAPYRILPEMAESAGGERGVAEASAAELSAAHLSAVQLSAAERSAAERSAAERSWPHRLALAQPRPYAPDVGVGASAGGPSHIFSHKGGLVQEAEGEGGGGWGRRAWPGAPYVGAGGPPAPAPEGPAPNWGGYARDWEGEARRGWPLPPPPPPRLDTMPVYLEGAPGTMPEVSAEYAAPRHALRDSAKKAPPPPPLAPPPPPPSPPAPPERATLPAHPAPLAHHDPAKHNNIQPERHLAAVVAAEESEEGARGAAAVLLLAVGVALTATLAALAACRARAQHRRRHRAKPFAHDPDYLVNGMYL